MLAFPGATMAHTDAASALPSAPGLQFDTFGVWSIYRAPLPMYAQALHGYLLQGDSGIDRRGAQLEHAVLQAGVRFDPTWGLQVAAGAHQSDPIHLEAAWLQTQGHVGTLDWTIGAGRQRPSLGPVLTRAGHFDSFGLMPLAKQASMMGDWIEDGVEAGFRHTQGNWQWQLDMGAWKGHSFPAGRPGRPLPSLHAGVQWSTRPGTWSADLVLADVTVQDRGAQVVGTRSVHSHTAPSCDTSLTAVVCFSGRSRLGGLSAQWQARDWPLRLTYAALRRNELGSLQSRNGLNDYQAALRGDWIQADWTVHPHWTVSTRHERLRANQTLVGAGATLVASDAGLSAYQPVRRTTVAVLGKLWPQVQLSLELGEERATSTAQRFVALRWHWAWSAKAI